MARECIPNTVDLKEMRRIRKDDGKLAAVKYVWDNSPMGLAEAKAWCDENL